MSVLRRLCLVPLAALLGGCYVIQAVQGHLAVMSRERPIGELLADPAAPPALRAKLESVRRIREFATRELALPDNGSFRAYAELDRPYVVWNVFAAAAFSVEAEVSCFWMVGCVPYRGYYRHADALGEARRLRERGLDVHVAGVPAYSTLGWFGDPVLSTFLGFPEPEVARVVFHELAHQVAYVQSDATFNESFAVAVEREGVQRWLAQAGSPAQREAWRQARLRQREFVDLMSRWRERAAAFYANSAGDPARPEGKLRLFGEMRGEYAALKASWGGFAGYDRILEGGINNALLASMSTYTALEPVFTAMIARHRGDMRAFYAEVKALARASPQVRGARMGAPPVASVQSRLEQRGRAASLTRP
ncbi:MAG: aminopeptidase [Burkholderiales bacterium]|nr:aminopeptidase [Burkholderiales bacterium]